MKVSRTYAVRKWDEEAIKWMAVAMVLGMVGLAVMPVLQPIELYFAASSGHLEDFYGNPATWFEILHTGAITAGIIEAATTAGVALGPAGWIALGIMWTPVLVD